MDDRPRPKTEASCRVQESTDHPNRNPQDVDDYGVGKVHD